MATAPSEKLFTDAVAGYTGRVRQKLKAIRKLIFDTAANTDGVGPLEETLKWGQLSYLTPVSKSGSTIRIDRAKGRDDAVAVYCHCQTDLVKTFRELYPDTFTFEGNRAVILRASSALPKEGTGPLHRLGADLSRAEEEGLNWCTAGPLPRPNHPKQGTLGVVGTGEWAGQVFKQYRLKLKPNAATHRMEPKALDVQPHITAGAGIE